MCHVSSPYWVRLRALREERGVSQAELFRRTRGVGFDTIRALEQDPARPAAEGRRSRARYPSPETLEAISEGLGVDPSVFPEYRLAKLRELLDERVLPGGLDEAWEHYLEFVTALRTRSTQSAKEIERTANTDGPLPATAGEVRSLLEARTRSRG